MRRFRSKVGALCAMVFLAAVSLFLFKRPPSSPTQRPVTTSGQEVPDPSLSAPDATTDQPDASADVPPAEPVEVVSECKAHVLVYHHIQDHYQGEDPTHMALNVSPRGLERHFSFLADNGYTVISYGRLVECMEKGVPVPEKAVVLAFDDRWVTQFRNAVPLLEKHRYPATFFITTDTNGPGAMSWQQLKQLVENSSFRVASHTKTHSLLVQETQELVLMRELNGSKQVIEQKLGKPVEFFAYPYGYGNERTAEAVRKAGYRAARTITAGSVHTKEDLFHMSAVQIPEDLDAFKHTLED